jgi:hypothetical protein
MDSLRRCERRADRRILRKADIFTYGSGTASQIWQGRLYFRPRGRDFVVVSFFEGKTDGFETD